MIQDDVNMTQAEFDEFMNGGMHESPAFELAPGLTAEEMAAVFFNTKALKAAPRKLFRLDTPNGRYYYDFNEAGEPEFFPSITTFIHELTPTSEHLIKWIADKGYIEAMKYVAYRASYGTFMHAQYADVTIQREYDLDKMKKSLKRFIDTELLPASFINEAEELKKDILAYAQFMNDVELEPLAIEIALISKKHGFAGTLDLPCMITYKGERFRALIDFKSGKKGFYRDNVLQLHAGKDAWNENFPECPIERVFNFAPNDWRKKPSYKFTEQTNDEAALDLPHLYAMARNHNKAREREFIHCSGVIKIGAPLDDNFKVLTLSETIKKHTAEKTPEEAIDATPESMKIEPYEYPDPSRIE